MNEETSATLPQEQVKQLPLWKGVLEEMRSQRVTYGTVWPAEYFEKRLRCTRETGEFHFSMMEIRQQIEKEERMYVKSEQNGALWFIPEANQHEDEMQRIERGVRRNSARVVNIREGTLTNPDAKLTDEERRRVESNLEKATFRYFLITRQNAVVDELKTSGSNLLKRVNQIAA